MGRLGRIGLTLLVVAAAVVAGTWVWDHYLYSPWTRDGRIRADVITIAPDVSGWVTELSVKNNRLVNKGDPLFTIDDTRYRAKFAESNARLAQERTGWDLARHQYERRQRMADLQSISEESLEAYRIRAEAAKASYQLAQAELDTARIDLERTQVLAPESGIVNNLSLRRGNYVARGEAVLSLINNDSFYVTGYFEETKLQQVHVGQKARITLLSGGEKLSGEVVSITRGIADSNTTSDSLMLPKVQAAFNWVRLAQRIPVDIALDPFPDNLNISAGMTVSIYLETDTENTPEEE
ncbi:MULTISPECIES: efflux RND transporter periplasmic adaptor subunit [Marinobacter]|uniref:HlyD family secretion protein n=1 Tax=Marinobacter xiaoshiensis TaxID=3073652 RepID=A0ABU2HDI9_9GAMM|nr:MULTISPECIES: HlyD family secretion protein [unclassified Marinobacter]MBK1873597.1 HlyD family secretion protein [Marinobacter sp. 1-3A]MBK1885184.1 HlyD family secretion protein [Marinobacter sp. DY40_1A1]MDS1309129.1 HlyD family secretion protein [Marinobacter sp. F60267]